MLQAVYILNRQFMFDDFMLYPAFPGSQSFFGVINVVFTSIHNSLITFISVQRK